MRLPAGSNIAGLLIGKERVELEFEPSNSFCYRFARYKAIPEILLESIVASGGEFRLVELARAVTDRYLTPEQQVMTFARAQTGKLRTVGRAIRAYIPFIVRNTNQLVSLGGGWYRLPSADDISEDELDEAAMQSDDGLEDEAEGEDLSGTVYAFTFPLLMRPNTSYPIKIGMARGDVEKRVALQCRQSAAFEQPRILGQWPAKRVRALELAVHNVLRSRGKWRDNAPGIEWFDTTVEEIGSIIEFVQAAE